MKICHFLKCSLFIIIVFLFLIGITNTNSSDKSIKVNEKNLSKMQKELKVVNNLSIKKHTLVKPKEENKKTTHKKDENKKKESNNNNKNIKNETNNNDKKETQEIKNNNVSERVGTENKSKTIATETSVTKNNSENKNNNKEKSSFKDFFTKTSKTNQSTAGKAFAAFIGGFILFYLSILLICNTERSSVVQAKYIDWINDEVKHVDLNRGESAEKDLAEKKPLLIEGKNKL